jgi:hypothetical protein
MKKLLLVLITVTAISCTVTEDSSSHQGIYVSPYIIGENNGVPFAFKIDDTGNYFSQASQFYINGPNPDAPYCFYYGMEMQSRDVAPGNSVGPSYVVSFKNMQSCYVENEPNHFYQAFDHTPTNFITDEQFSNIIKGAEVGYWSPNKYYSTLYGSQAGSAMTITRTTRSVMPGGSLKTVIVSGTFHCKLYDGNNPSDVMTITNGKFCITCQSYY